MYLYFLGDSGNSGPPGAPGADGWVVFSSVGSINKNNILVFF